MAWLGYLKGLAGAQTTDITRQKVVDYNQQINDRECDKKKTSKTFGNFSTYLFSRHPEKQFTVHKIIYIFFCLIGQKRRTHSRAKSPPPPPPGC